MGGVVCRDLGDILLSLVCMHCSSGTKHVKVRVWVSCPFFILKGKDRGILGAPNQSLAVSESHWVFDGWVGG